MTLRLRHLAEINPPTPEFDRLPFNSEVTFMPLETVWADDRIDTSRARPKMEVAIGYTRFRNGDVVVPKVTPTFQAGRSAIVEGLTNGVGAGTTELHVLRARPGNDARFLRYVTLSAHFLTDGVSSFQGVAGLQRVPDQFLRNFPVNRFSLEGQCRIADFLDYELSRLMFMAQACRSLRKLLQERRWVAVHAAVTGGGRAEPIRSCDLGWARTLASAWPIVPLKYVARLGSGHTPSRTHSEYWENCSIPWVSLFDVGRMRDVRQEYIAETEQKISEVGMANSSACLHPSGTVVLSRTASVGFSAIMATDMAVSQHFVTWTCGPRLKSEYLLYVLRSMWQYFESVQVGTTNVTVFMPDLYSIKIPLPSLVEQGQIIARAQEWISAIDELDDGIRREFSLLEERRRALITAAVTGQIDVTTARGVTG